MLEYFYKEPRCLEQYFKFDEKSKKAFLASSEKKNIKDFIKLLRTFKKKKISGKAIKLFYEDPKKFFENYKKLLQNTCYLDICGISIFEHYFYVIDEYDKYKNFKVPKKKFEFEVYESNFNSFFTETKKYLLLQDVNLDTPLHKLAKKNDKKLFFKIY